MRIPRKLKKEISELTSRLQSAGEADGCSMRELADSMEKADYYAELEPPIDYDKYGVVQTLKYQQIRRCVAPKKVSTFYINKTP